MDTPTKNCPYCQEDILAVAKKCKHCKEFLHGNSLQQPLVDRAVTGQPQNCSLAVVAFVFAMVSIVCGLTCIPAIICGHMAIAQCNNNPSLQGKGYAVAAVVISYVIAAIGLLIGLFWLGIAGLLMTS